MGTNHSGPRSKGQNLTEIRRGYWKIAVNIIGVHILRHTHATIMMRAGRPAREVADRLGHSSTKLTTDTYSHVLPDQQQEGVQAYERRLGRREGE
jgi:integrase